MKFVPSLVAVAVAVLTVGTANAQDYPGTKPVTFVVPFAAGGPTDRVARDLAEAMRKTMPGGNFTVENAAGAGGTIGGGSTITKSTEPGALSVARGKQVSIAHWARPQKAKKA